MDENCVEELNNLTQVDVVKILATKSTKNVKISANLKEYFNSIFVEENSISSSCSKCNEISEELEVIKAELKKRKDFASVFDTNNIKARKEDNTSKCTDNNDKFDTKHEHDNAKVDKMGIKTFSSPETYTVSQLEAELKEFYDSCKENHLSDEEIANICKPLRTSLQNFPSHFLRYFAIALMIITTLYLLSYFETVYWHYAAVWRIFLIEILPFWNWQTLKDARCLIKPLSEEVESVTVQECTFCEYINRIDVLDTYIPENIHEKYIKLHKPVLLEKGLANWMGPVEFKDLLEMILNDEVLSESHPCKFKSNVYYGSGNLYDILKDIWNNDIYFTHFQNCEFDAVKSFRKYISRPQFLAAQIMPIQYSWILVSNNYNVANYKPVALSDQITVVGQFSGRNDVLLHPNQCSEDCEPLKIELVKGEVLIFSGWWNMEYKPAPEGQNFAVILETH